MRAFTLSQEYFSSKYPAWTYLLVLALSVAVSGCNKGTTREEGPDTQNVNFDSLVKTDVGVVLEIHVRESRSLLRELMGKLYKRNPRELKKSAYPTAEENIDRLFEQRHGWNFPELEGKRDIEAIKLTFDEGFQGDRVFAFVAGLTSMLMATYNYKTEFYVLDSVDPQSLYNSARNIEIAVWRLGNEYDSHNELYLFSNSLPGEIANLSYERIFGKLISLQDTIAIIVAGKTNRTLIKVVQRMVTAVFLPIF